MLPVALPRRWIVGADIAAPRNKNGLLPNVFEENEAEKKNQKEKEKEKNQRNPGPPNNGMNK